VTDDHRYRRSLWKTHTFDFRVNGYGIMNLRGSRVFPQRKGI